MIAEPARTLFVVLQSTRELSALLGELRGVVTELDPSLAVARIIPMESLVADALGPDRFVAMLFTLFAATAATLAVIGLYGVVSYTVGRRLPELGVRIAFGAQRADIQWLLLRSSLALVGVGLVGGSVGALLLMRVMETLLFGVSADDPWIYGGVALSLAGIAGAATAVPARRASRTDPNQILRAE